jgi:hypothetical protein
MRRGGDVGKPRPGRVCFVLGREGICFGKRCILHASMSDRAGATRPCTVVRTVARSVCIGLHAPRHFPPVGLLRQLGWALRRRRAEAHPRPECARRTPLPRSGATSKRGTPPQAASPVARDAVSASLPPSRVRRRQQIDASSAECLCRELSRRLEKLTELQINVSGGLGLSDPDPKVEADDKCVTPGDAKTHRTSEL